MIPSCIHGTPVSMRCYDCPADEQAEAAKPVRRTTTMLAVALVEGLDRVERVHLETISRDHPSSSARDIVAAKNRFATTALSEYGAELARLGSAGIKQALALTGAENIDELVLLVSELRRERDRLAARNLVLEERVQKAIGTLGGRTP